MKLTSLTLVLIITILSCKKDNQNNNNHTAGYGTFERDYTLFDSAYIWRSNATGDTTEITHYPLNRQLHIIFDSTTNYILAGKDTFSYNNKYPDYAGYYKYFLNPNDCDKIVLTKDSVFVNYSRYLGGHMYETRMLTGNKK
ncbi:hypothetical protein CAP35_06145 [Chitinophagaceae bacterium IBVUCB1]|nr:hypothetical protein CAP35_06145 [Chitinophagaceae bacterium IBVUCB1]